MTSLGLKNPRCPHSHVWRLMRHLGSSPVAANLPVGQPRMAVSGSKKVKVEAASLNSWNHTASHPPYSIGQNKSESQPGYQGSAEIDSMDGALKAGTAISHCKGECSHWGRYYNDLPHPVIWWTRIDQAMPLIGQSKPLCDSTCISASDLWWPTTETDSS